MELEPKHYIRVYTSRELDEPEVELLADIIYDYLDSEVEGEEILVHDSEMEDGWVAYVFPTKHCIIDDVEKTKMGDAIALDINSELPDDIDWEMEASLPDLAIEADEKDSAEQINEQAIQKYRQMLAN
jgi:hypothetical protein